GLQDGLGRGVAGLLAGRRIVRSFWLAGWPGKGCAWGAWRPQDCLEFLACWTSSEEGVTGLPADQKILCRNQPFCIRKWPVKALNSYICLVQFGHGFWVVRRGSF